MRPQEAVYVVQPGDSLWEIARAHGVTVSERARWNRIDARRPIHPGLRLRIENPARMSADLNALPSGPVPDETPPADTRPFSRLHRPKSCNVAG